MDVEEKVASDDTLQGDTEGQQTQTADVSTDSEAEAAADLDSTANVPESPEQFDWSKYEGAENWVGRSPKEIADYYNRREYLYGQQSNELGQLRKQVEEYEKLKEQVTGKKEEKPKSYDDYDKARFANKFNDNPQAMLDEYFGSHADSIAEKVYKLMDDKIGNSVETKAQDVASRQEFSQFAKAHPDFNDILDAKQGTTTRDMMSRLMQDDYLGGNVPFEEAYKLAKMTKEESSLFGVTCMFMQRGFPFETAREYASLKQNHAKNAETKKEQIKQEVQGASAGLKHDSTKQGTSEPVINTMDDAFNV